ncbi:hypothetical protein X733_02035 [Mesorhizobium sp. L2C067A000]|nr:hypothetical protein X733_02035 [Mesorhizobium sp. L2C067A000]
MQSANPVCRHFPAKTSRFIDFRDISVAEMSHIGAIETHFHIRVNQKSVGSIDICASHNKFVLGQVFLSMPSLGVSSLDFDRVVQTMRSFFTLRDGQRGIS